MDKERVLNIIEETGVVAVLRLKSPDKIRNVVDALIEGGIRAIEFTMSIPGCLQLISEFRSQMNGASLIGVGTVLNGQEARQAIQAGAQFVVSPILDPEIIQEARAANVPVFPGAYTPTEIFKAWSLGADIVKVFPATSLGPRFFKDIHGPMSEIKLTPTGGVSLENTAEFIRMGAACVGVGTALLRPQLIENDDWPGLQELAARFIQEVKKGRKVIA